MSMMCIMAYFIPRYLEYTTFVNIGILGTLIAGLKAASYLLALVWLFIRAVRGRKCPLLFLLVITAVLGYFTYQAGIKKHNTLFIVLLFSLVLDECYFDRYLTVILRSSVVLYVLTLLASAGSSGRCSPTGISGTCCGAYKTGKTAKSCRKNGRLKISAI